MRLTCYTEYCYGFFVQDTVEQCDVACGGRAIATGLDTDVPADTLLLGCQEACVITTYPKGSFPAYVYARYPTVVALCYPCECL